MNDLLAERLLSKIMNWSIEDVTRERPVIQLLARFKYDQYDQFAPGMKFIESLALWLEQFDTIGERKTAYEFFRDKIIFISYDEMMHYVGMTFPYLIRPILCSHTAKMLNIPEWSLKRIIDSKEYKMLLRKSLFLGLSDGAHIGFFRRCNPELSNEQIWLTYDITDKKAVEMKEKLNKDIRTIMDCGDLDKDNTFRMLFLLDDFSGSGISSYREEGEDVEQKIKGKIVKILDSIESGSLSKTINKKELCIVLILYVASEKALGYLKQKIPKKYNFSIQAVQLIKTNVQISKGMNVHLDSIIDKYYDPIIQDEHTEKGKTDLKYGFAGCGLPLVLFHNTPNNSLYLLWAETDKLRPLFPRVTRHKEK